MYLKRKNYVPNIVDYFPEYEDNYISQKILLGFFLLQLIANLQRNL